MASQQNSSGDLRPILVTCSVSSFDQVPENGTRADNLENQKKMDWKNVSIFRPAVVSFVVVLASLVNGMGLAYPITAIPNLNNQQHASFQMNQDQLSWFRSFYFLGAIPGALISGWAMDHFGRKATILFTILPYVFGWLSIAGAVNVAMMHLGRLLTGFCFGLMFPVIQVYIAEISPPKIRANLMSFHQLAVNIGLLSMYILGSFIPWNWCAIDCGLVLTMMACALLHIPESPRWLIMHNNKDKAVIKLQWLRGKNVDVSEEIRDIEESVKDPKDAIPIKQCLKAPFLKWFIISHYLYALHEICGVGVFFMYTELTFRSANADIGTNADHILVAVVLVAGSVLFTAVVEKRDRRYFLIISCLMMALGLVVMGSFLQVKTHFPDVAGTYLFWLPLLAMATTCVGNVMGVGNLPFVVTSELFPNRGRGRVAQWTMATLFLCAFLLSQYLILLINVVTVSGIFFLVGLNSFTGFKIAYVFALPPTKGKKLEEIENEFISPKSPE